MTLWLPLLAFAFGSLLVTAVTYALTAKPANIDDRLRDVLGNQPQLPERDASNDQIVAFLKKVGERLPKSPKDLGKDSASTRAGRAPQPRSRCRYSSRFASALRSRCLAFCMTPLLIKPNMVDWRSPAPWFGYLLPGMLLARKARRRQHRIRLSLADALDLLVVSVEAGLGLDQALARVAQELAFAYPDLSSELRLVNLELLAGKGRSEALRNLADRTGVDDLSSLVAMLVQTDKFGTSVAQLAARVLGDAADQAAPARRRSGGEDRREDGLPARRLHLPGYLDRHDWPGGHPVHEGARPDGQVIDDDDMPSQRTCKPAQLLMPQKPASLEATGCRGRYARVDPRQDASRRRSQRHGPRRSRCVCRTASSNRCSRSCASSC